MFNLSFIGLFLLIVSYSCKKDPAFPKPVIPKWHMVYKFVQLSHADTIDGVAVDCATVFPDSNRTDITTHVFNELSGYPKIKYNDTLSVTITPEKVYKGCTKQIAVRISFRNGRDKYGAKIFYDKNYFLDYKPINGPKDTVEYFRYPTDTIIAHPYHN